VKLKSGKRAYFVVKLVKAKRDELAAYFTRFLEDWTACLIGMKDKI
jgi:hypothetical protein